MDSARLFNCACCNKQVIICSHCDRGNVYCGLVCSNDSRLKGHRAANQRYQKTLKGRQKHAYRQQRYRERQKANIKKVTDQSSMDLISGDLLAFKPSDDTTVQAESLCCDFCRKSVWSFLRNGYLRHHSEDRWRCSSSWSLGP